MSKINRAFFFEHIKKALFGGRMSQTQVTGLNTILDHWEGLKGPKDDRWLAYALGTTYHETARTMQPIIESGGPAYKTRLYDIKGDNPARARKYGNTTPGDGVKYAGAGYVQLTWKNNYLRAGQKLKLDLVNKPELARQPAVAAAVMFAGMTEGWFTGKKFADYFAGPKSDWRNARRIINGTDKAVEIANYSIEFYKGISYTV